MSVGKHSLNAAQAKKAPKLSKTALRIERAKIVIPHRGLVFNHEHYVFIARLKRGEIWALNCLKPNSKSMVSPVFEIGLPDPPQPNKAPKTLIQHATDSLERIATEWTGLPFYLDPKYLGPKDAPPTPDNVQAVFALTQSMGLRMVPVTSPFFPPTVQRVVKNVIKKDDRGVMFRLTVDFFANLQNVSTYLDGLMAALEVTAERVDILVDLGYRPSIADVQVLGTYCFSSLPLIKSWRTVTLASGCFPDSITKEPSGQWIPYSRTDWLGWNAFATQRAKSGLRVPTYGDYGVRCGGRPQPVPNGPAPNIRYSDSKTIWVRKGPKKVPGVMKAICTDLIGKPFFAGATFSEGDNQIALKAANSSVTNAQAEQWIQWCANHHLELTSSQIRSRP
jgi:hypothetical protein